MLERLLFLLIIFFSNFIQTITGFAGTMLAMPFSIRLVGAEDARYILNVVALVVSLFVVVRTRKYINKAVLKDIIIFMGIGIAIGLVMSRQIDFTILLKGYGIFIIISGIYNLSKLELKISEGLFKVVLVAAGIIHGLFVSGGALLVLYASKKLPDKDEFRSTLSSVWLILNSILLIEIIITGRITYENKILLAWSIPPLVISIILGQMLQSKISQPIFSVLTNILLIISGLSIIFSKILTL